MRAKCQTCRVSRKVARAHQPIDGGESGTGISPMSKGWTQTHGQDARATAGTQMPPSIGRCAQVAVRLTALQSNRRIAGFFRSSVSISVHEWFLSPRNPDRSWWSALSPTRWFGRTAGEASWGQGAPPRNNPFQLFVHDATRVCARPAPQRLFRLLASISVNWWFKNPGSGFWISRFGFGAVAFAAIRALSRATWSNRAQQDCAPTPICGHPRHPREKLFLRALCGLL